MSSRKLSALRISARAAEFGQPALGLTDHGVMNGAVELYKACRKHGIKPILGLEAYFVDDRRAEDSERRAQSVAHEAPSRTK
jgi:DNA polymerase-3 subunit alpha